MPSSVKNLKLKTYDDIFKTDSDGNGEKILEIPLSELHSFANGYKYEKGYIDK